MNCIRPSLGQKSAMVVMAGALGIKAPRANPTLKEPASALAIALYKAFDDMTDTALGVVLRELEGDSYEPGTKAGLLRRAKGYVNYLLEIETDGGDADGLTAAWRMWPLTTTKKEKTMSTSKQATRKKTASKKKTTKKRVMRKVKPRKGRTAKKRAGSRGKPAAARLKTPVKKDGKRGKVLARFMQKSGKTPGRAATELGTNRSNVLSHLHDLHKYHGIGYELNGDGPVSILLPKGCRSPWA